MTTVYCEISQKYTVFDNLQTKFIVYFNIQTTLNYISTALTKRKSVCSKQGVEF